MNVINKKEGSAREGIFIKNFANTFEISAVLAVLMLAWADPVAAQKPDPAGIVRLVSDNYSRPERLAAWRNPNLDGMRVRADWNAVQPTSSTFDWSHIDELLTLGAQHGKLIGVSVAAGIFTPQWVYDSGAIEYAIQDGTGNSMPIPWDDAFLTKWLAFVDALGARYDGNPALGYVVMSGMGQIVETYMAQTAQDTINLTNLGGASAWRGAAKQIIAAYANAFPTTPFFITAAKPFHNAHGLSALQNVVDWGVARYPGRFGIMNASLNAQSNTLYYSNLAVYTYRITQPVGFQMLCAAARDPVRLRGTLDQALMRGVQLGAKFVEVYPVDADDPEQQTVLAVEGAALKLNASPTPTVTPTPSATDLRVTVTDGAPIAGRNDTYTIRVTNLGPNNVTGAVVSDSFPDIFTGVIFTATQNGGVSGFTATGAGNISDTLTMPVGSFVTYRATGTVSSSAAGTLSNTATVTPPTGVTDPNLANNSATDTDTITVQADLKVKVTDRKTTVIAGRRNTYTIVVTNSFGPSDISGAVVSDSFPDTFTGVTFTATESGGASGFTASGTGNIYDTVTLPASSHITYKVKGTISTSARGPISVTATVDAPSGVIDPNLANNSATDTDTVQ
jgi:uncharacterized repeat protein (TIGR01451 family)